MKKITGIFLSLLFIFAWQVKIPVHAYAASATWQVNSKKPTSEQLKHLFQQNDSHIEVDDQAVNYGEVGNYDIDFIDQQNDVITEQLLIEKDSPIEEVRQVVWTLPVEEDMVISDEMATAFYRQNTMDNQCEVVVLEHSLSLNSVGQYHLPVKITDEFGRQLHSEIALEIVDQEAPTIALLSTHLYYTVSDQLSVERFIQDGGIQIEDNYDSTVQPIIDFSSVDSSRLGQYKVAIHAVDAAGNKAQMRHLNIHIVPPTILPEQLEYEVYTSITSADFIADLQVPTIKKVDLSKIDFQRLGKYNAFVVLKNDEKRQVEVSIVDRTAPIIQTATSTIYYAPDEQVTKGQVSKDLALHVTDNFDNDVEVSFTSFMKKKQSYIEIHARDRSGNSAKKMITIVDRPLQQQESTWSYEDEKEPRKSFYPVTITANKEKKSEEIAASTPIKKQVEKTKDAQIETAGVKLPVFIIPIFILLLLSFWLLKIRKYQGQRLVNKRSRRHL
ncbi:hypothetical protein [Kurthia sibirica]|uniref:Internalin I Ig-like domain-containing protein n=1 Tax=Kurthia sibirica TaxID=202750 RepID=A0A2U3AR14_9BACL|nr:hypothetical protein [Kurthia sibirica]PWI26977.1 hypothetical protein DEX24_01375 [Kurthia sibirica]GEK32473.1 hypothetical protein KSI01_00060 [Kurthia sibirica]